MEADGDRDRFADALLDALLAMWKHLEKLRGDGARSYLYRIASRRPARPGNKDRRDQMIWPTICQRQQIIPRI